MRFIFGFIGLMFALDALWFSVSLRLAKPIRLPLVLFALGQIGGLLWLLAHRFNPSASMGLIAKSAVTILFIWHMILLPLLLVLAIALLPVLVAVAIVRWMRRRRDTLVPQSSNGLTRRQFLGAGLAATPPLLNLSLAGIALRQLDQFRVRRFRLPIADLPRGLHGLTIVQVSAMHVGRFTSGRVLSQIVGKVNELGVDLVLLTGDLINDALADLDHALDLVRSMQAASGVYLIEGNHDLIENGAEFEWRVKHSGIPFLLDESALLSIRGEPVQLLGLRWTRTYQDRDAHIAASVYRLLRQREPDAFPILLAHHPHAFDAAAEAGLPLTLSGHTHGGQLMLNEQCGFGPALFRYWSGLYTRASSNLIVSNGVGNWFPLRVRAPAEVLHITLIRT